jgi:hypothetical protein
MRIVVAGLFVIAGSCLAGWPLVAFWAAFVIAPGPMCWSCGMNATIGALLAAMFVAGLALAWGGILLARPRRL